MNAVLVESLLGGDREWSGPCVVVLDAEASVKTPGPDSVVTGGQKSYAPRFSSGRIEADACYLLKDLSALVLVSQQTFKDSTGASHVRQTMVVADLAHVVALEFTKLTPLKRLGVEAPVINDSEYRAGMLVG
ncbi:MAG TPA: hypothetical protein VM533_11505 [Fimbriiglobus sp.]|nr:hypothetical protein [Fimbriiglobus sp.]